MSPENKEKDVRIDRTIKVWFSDPVDKNTVNIHSFRIFNEKKSEEVTITSGDYIHGFKTAEIKPTLQSSTDYAVTVTTEVKDLNGKPLATEEKWSFKTTDEGAKSSTDTGIENQKK